MVGILIIVRFAVRLLKQIRQNKYGTRSGNIGLLDSGNRSFFHG